MAVKLLEMPIVESRGIPIALEMEARERFSAIRISSPAFCKAISCGEADGVRGRDGSVAITSSLGGVYIRGFLTGTVRLDRPPCRGPPRASQ